MNLLKIDWLGCDYCINVGYAEVTTESNDTKWLWSGDEVKCPECGIQELLRLRRELLSVCGINHQRSK